MPAREFERRAPDWRVLDTTGVWAWFDAPSTSAAAVLAIQVARLWDEAAGAARPALDLRRTGLAVRLPDGDGLTTAELDLALGISRAAADRG